MYGNFGGGQGGPGRDFAPVKVGEELDVKIEAVGEKGDGIARVKGFVLFVPDTKENDEVKIKITRVLRKVGFAEVIGPGSVPKEEAQEESQTAAEVSQAEEEPKEDSEDFGEESEDFGEEEADSEEEAQPEEEEKAPEEETASEEPKEEEKKEE